MTILILHGIGGHAGIHWQQWVHDQLVQQAHTVLMPSLPDSNHPDRTVWRETAQRLLEDVLLRDLIIIGHSLGVATALDVIEELHEPIRGLICVSGFGDDYGAKLNSYFMKEKEIDFEKVHKNLQNTFVIYGDDDPYVPQKSLKLLSDNLHVQPIVIHQGGHLNTGTGYTEFQLIGDLIEKME